jgi:hypothetical protein
MILLVNTQHPLSILTPLNLLTSLKSMEIFVLLIGLVIFISHVIVTFKIEMAIFRRIIV